MIVNINKFIQYINYVRKCHNFLKYLLLSTQMDFLSPIQMKFSPIPAIPLPKLACSESGKKGTNGNDMNKVK